MDKLIKNRMMKKSVCLVFALVMLSFLVSAGPGLEVSSLLLKVSLEEDESLTRSFSVTSPDGKDYSLEVVAVPGVELSEHNFVLNKDEKRTIDVSFDSSGIEAGIYVGSIDIKSMNLDESLRLPLILEIESEDIFFDANLDIPPAYSEVEPGGRVIAQIKVFDLTSGGGTSEGVNGLGTVSVDLEYSVFDLEGNVLSSENERIVVDKQAQISKTFSFPEEIDEGDYVMAVVARYGSSVGISSQMFSISGKVMSSPSLGVLNSSSSLVFVLILAFTLGIVFLFVYILRDRDKFIGDLRRYHSRELKMQRELLTAQVRMLRRKGSDEKIVRKEVAEKVKVLKNEQKSRVNELRKLKKSGNVKEMARRVREWEKRGYGVGGLKYKLKEMSVKDMRKLMGSWKREGYN